MEVRKISEADKSSFRSNVFRWLTEDARGVWIVRLAESGVADHCVVVDTSVALIFDCATEHLISLTEEALRLCDGDDSRHLRVAEVRLLVPRKSKPKNRESGLDLNKPTLVFPSTWLPLIRFDGQFP